MFSNYLFNVLIWCLIIFEQNKVTFQTTTGTRCDKIRKPPNENVQLSTETYRIKNYSQKLSPLTNQMKQVFTSIIV